MNEGHVIHRSSDHHEFWITCDGQMFAKASIVDMFVDPGIGIPADWFEKQLKEHMEKVHEQPKPKETNLCSVQRIPGLVCKYPKDHEIHDRSRAKRSGWNFHEFKEE